MNLFHLVSRRLLEPASVHWTIKLEDQALVHLRFAIDTRQENPPHVCLVALVSPSSSLQALQDSLTDPFVCPFSLVINLLHVCPLSNYRCRVPRICQLVDWL